MAGTVLRLGDDDALPAPQHPPSAANARPAGTAGDAPAAPALLGPSGGPFMTTSAEPKRPALEVADILRQHGDAFFTKYGGCLTPEQRQALVDLSLCRTAALGGHIERCADCG